ncbi:hypothetical protein EBAPG3_008360 [Nitrosospira lacus]|uniref:Uncharacterized protein n=1 Tax=Nitrosospira lacus TaxID=1288494 RepID=A0A1W6SPQ5_9PROT|nr:hypothetical protein [Nitrosospira lacus]ARO87779.1 hypothetical protein EBAPG3_008360 [Nitrosospira lacus]
MPKLTHYVKMAANEYLEETGRTELNARWIAEFFQDCGVQDAYPRQDLVVFAEMVQKELTKNEEQAAKKTRLLLDKTLRGIKSARKL